VSCPLPPEIFDLILDYLRDEQAALKACCVVSKSWIPRARKHLFAHVAFDAENCPIGRWKKTFPDPSSSPAHHTQSLSIRGLQGVGTAGVDVRRWVRTFHRVVDLHVSRLGWWDESRDFLAQLHGFSPTLKSLHLSYSSIPPSEIFDFICSFPLLENLVLDALWPKPDVDGWKVPSTSPKLTGSLEVVGVVRPFVHQLCNLPGGLHFSRIMMRGRKEDTESIMGLVSRCSDTLESLSILYYPSNLPGIPSFDLSGAKILKSVEFWYNGLDIGCIIMAVQAGKPKSLQQITIRLPAAFSPPTEETVHQGQGWEDLDRLLIQLWTSRSIRPKVVCESREEECDSRDLAQILLPELAKRGFIETVECD